MNELLNHVYELSNPQIMSSILLICILADTLTSCLWRNKKNENIFSKSLWVGFALNLLGASVPFILYVIQVLLHIGFSYFLTGALISWSVIFGCATIFSLIANYKLYSNQSYEFLLNNVPKILKAEMENKISKVQKG